MSDRIKSYRAIWKLSWPIILANLTIPLITATDTAVMGHQAEPKFIAGIALGGIFFNFLYTGFNFLRMGTTGLVAQSFGAKDNLEVKSIIMTSLIIAGCLGLLIIIACFPSINIIQALLSASKESKDLMRQYILVRIFDAPATLMNMVFLGIFFGMGAPKSAMSQLILISVFNVTLSIVFVFSFNWGIQGVAFASVIAQWFGMFLSFYLLIKIMGFSSSTLKIVYFSKTLINKFRLSIFFKISKDLLIRTFCLVSAELILINEASKFGDEYLAATQIYIVILGFIAYGLDGFAHAAETIVGQAIGKRDVKTIKPFIVKIFIIAVLSSIVFSLLLLIFNKYIFYTLTQINEVLMICNSLIPFLIVLPLFGVWPYILDGIFIGATETRSMRNSSIIAVLVLFLLIKLNYNLEYGLSYVWGSFLTYLVLRAVYLALQIKKIFKRAI